MRFFTITTIILMISAMSIAQTVGLKSSEKAVRYFNFDAEQGIENLRREVSNQVYVTRNQMSSAPSSVSGGLTLPGYCRAGSETQDALKFLGSHQDVFGLMNPESEMRLMTYETDQLLMKHIKFQQYVNNVKIYPSQVVVHINNDGSIESVAGNYIPTPLNNFTSYISSDAAVSLAKTILGNYTPNAVSSEYIYYRKGVSLIPAYEVRLPSKFTPNMVLYINAADGSLIYKDDGLRYDGPAVGTGTSLSGASKQINTYLMGGKYYLVNSTLSMFTPPIDSLWGVVATYDAKNSTNETHPYDLAELVSDPNDDNNFNDNTTLRAAVDAHIFTAQVYDFFKKNYNRNSFDNAGGTLTNVVHYKNNYNNAFWNGAFMSYGDGDGVQFSNLAGALDVITHEITHGVNQRTANLVYLSQSGALSESVSDVFAALHDSTDWLIGEDVYTPGTAGDALRSMSDPHNGAVQGMNEWQPAHMSEYLTLPETEAGDNGGVHVNSGIPNKAFYNAATAIGRWKAGQIWYRTLAYYLTTNSQFKDLRVGALLAAKDLYGEGSAEYNAVKTAFDNVGIDESTTTTYQLIYDDGTPDTGLYENLANWKIANLFTAPVSNISVDQVAVYITGDQNNGTGRFILEIFAQNNLNLPGTSLLSPYDYTPQYTGWQEFTVSNVNASSNFFVSMKYDGVNWPLIGADNPPGQGRTYEYDPGSNSWYKLTGTNDYLLFMRAAVSSTVSDIEMDNAVPESFGVSESYPNPFNPSTSIRYSLPDAQKVLIAVYDLNGSKVAELANNFQNPGTYTISWNGKNDQGSNVSSGIYYCKIEAGDYSSVRKMVLMK